MRYRIEYGPAYAIAIVDLGPGEKIKTEAGAMVSMSSDMQIETGMSGGVFGGLRRMIGKESFFMNTYVAGNQGGELVLAPALSGDMNVIELSSEELTVQSGSYVASEEGIDIDTSWGGARTFFGGEGLFMLKASGSGKLVISSYGAIRKISLDGSRRMTVDTGHIVAFTQGLNFNVRKVGGMKSTLFSGEGLVSDFEGSGDLYMQTRSPDHFLSWLIPQLPSGRSN